MKLSSTWFALILIVSALLLSGVSNARPDGNDTPKIQNDGDQHQQNGKAVAPSPEQFPTDKSSANSYPGTYNYKGTFNYGPKYNGPSESGLAKAAYVASIISAAFLTLFTGLLVLLNRKLVGLTNNLSKATAAAAKAAEAALHVNRPFLLITNVKCGEIVRNNDGYIPYSFTITLRNFGVGPADMVGYSAGGVPYDAPDVYGQREPQITYTSNDTPLRELVSPGDVAENLIPKVRLDLYDDMLRDIQSGKKRIGIDGQIRYRGAAPEQIYWT